MHSCGKRERMRIENSNNVGKSFDFRQQRSINVVVKPPHANGAHQVMELCNSPNLNQVIQNNFNIHQQRQQQQEQSCHLAMEQVKQQKNNKQLKGNNKHPSKLLSSKSLSHFVSKGFFFGQSKKQQKMSTTKSLPNCPTIDINNNNSNDGSQSNHRIPKQTSLAQLPRHSSKRSLELQSNTISSSMINSTIDQPNVSPIIGTNNNGRITIDGFNLSPPTSVGIDSYESLKSYSQDEQDITTNNNNKNHNPKEPIRKDEQEGAENEDCNTMNNLKKKSKLKNTKLILRDVKNSISLRMRAKHDSQAFSKLTNELATPPTKLYSPFNIYLDSCSKDSKRKVHMDKNRADRDLSLLAVAGSASSNISGGGGHFNCSMEIDCDDEMLEDINNARHFETPAKRRIALQHKKHLIQANKFTFDSPTGRFKETVKDVEQFQQCIEDISKAIRARETIGQ